MRPQASPCGHEATAGRAAHTTPVERYGRDTGDTALPRDQQPINARRPRTRWPATSSHVRKPVNRAPYPELAATEASAAGTLLQVPRVGVAHQERLPAGRSRWVDRHSHATSPVVPVALEQERKRAGGDIKRRSTGKGTALARGCCLGLAAQWVSNRVPTFLSGSRGPAYRRRPPHTGRKRRFPRKCRYFVLDVLRWTRRRCASSGADKL